MPPGGGPLPLRWRGTNSTQRLEHRPVEAPGKIGGLVETAFSPARGMERNRHDTERAGEHLRAAGAHHGCQPRGEGSSAFVFQCMHDCAKRSIVGADRPSLLDRRPSAPTARTFLRLNVEHTPRSQWVAADLAERRCERENRTPAGPTDWSGGWVFEQCLANGA